MGTQRLNFINCSICILNIYWFSDTPRSTLWLFELQTEISKTKKQIIFLFILTLKFWSPYLIFIKIQRPSVIIGNVFTLLGFSIGFKQRLSFFRNNCSFTTLGITTLYFFHNPYRNLKYVFNVGFVYHWTIFIIIHIRVERDGR